MLILSAQLEDFYRVSQSQLTKPPNTVETQEGCIVTGHQGASTHSKAAAFSALGKAEKIFTFSSSLVFSD